MNLVLTRAALEPRRDRDPQMRLQDVQLLRSPTKREQRKRPAALAGWRPPGADRSRHEWRSFRWPQMGEFGRPPGVTSLVHAFARLARNGTVIPHSGLALATVRGCGASNPAMVV
jgi:hypothetical protein